MSCSPDASHHEDEKSHIPAIRTLDGSKNRLLASVGKSSSTTDLAVVSNPPSDHKEGSAAAIRGELDSSTPAAYDTGLSDFVTVTNNNQKPELPRENISALSTQNFRFALIVLALCLAIFLVALVSFALDANHLPL